MTTRPAPMAADPASVAPRARGDLLRTGRAPLQPFLVVVAASGLGLVLLLGGIVAVVTKHAWPAFREFGPSFLSSQDWNPVTDHYGALPLIFGTLVTSLVALVIAAPLGIGVSIFLTEDLLPKRVRTVLAFMVELLAAIPSVIYGLWGLAVVVPLTTRLGLPLFKALHAFPLFSTPPVGPGILPASIVLAIMILPTIAALSRSSLRTVPAPLTEGAYALGSTRWQVLLAVTLPGAWTGIVGAMILALGRALGETMALAMLVGNSNRISASLFAPANTIASLLANSFGEASGLQLSALMYLSFILMAMTLVVNFLAQGILTRTLGGKRLT